MLRYDQQQSGEYTVGLDQATPDFVALTQVTRRCAPAYDLAALTDGLYVLKEKS
jgi:hypothetical protein